MYLISLVILSINFILSCLRRINWQLNQKSFVYKYNAHDKDISKTEKNGQQL